MSEIVRTFVIDLENNLKTITTMTYKGYKINKVSRYIFSNYGNKDGYFWNVNKNCKNVSFNTLKEAKEWVNNAIRKEEILEEMKAKSTIQELTERVKRDGERALAPLTLYIMGEYVRMNTD